MPTITADLEVFSFSLDDKQKINSTTYYKSVPDIRTGSVTISTSLHVKDAADSGKHRPSPPGRMGESVLETFASRLKQGRGLNGQVVQILENTEPMLTCPLVSPFSPNLGLFPSSL